MEPILFFLACLGIGALAGYLGGLMGLGGGVIVVPTLLPLLEYSGTFNNDQYPENTVVLVVLATSMSTIVFTTSSSAIAQIRRNSVDWSIVSKWVIFLMLGVTLAAVIAESLPAVATKLFIACFIAIIAMIMVTNWKPDPNRKSPGMLLTAVLASVGGVISGLAGIGGGNVVVPTLLFFNTAIVKATAVASTLGIAISLAGTISWAVLGIGSNIPYSIGYIFLPALFPIALGCTIFAQLGVRTAHKVQAGGIRRAFGCLMFLVAGSMVYSAM